MTGYNQKDDAAVKAAGNRAFDGLAALSATLRAPASDGWRDHGVARRIVERAFGVLPFGDGPNKLSDREIEALVPRVEGAADLVEALLAETESFMERRKPSWLRRFRKAFCRA